MLKIKGGEVIPDAIMIPTPSFGLNYILGGGIKTGNIHIFWGSSQSGKTTMSLYILAELQRQGYHAIIIDTEHSISEQWLEHCGVNIEREVWRGNIVEDMLKDLVPVLKSGKKVVVLFDSINGIEWESFYDNVDSSSGMAGGARARRLLWLKVLEYTHPVNNVFLAVAQQTMDPGSMAKMPIAKLGEAEKHWSCNIIKLFSSHAAANVERDKDTERITSKKVKWTIQKSKQQPVEGSTGYYWLDPVSSKIDRKQELVNLAVKNDVIVKGGAWFNYDGQKFHGLDNVLEALTDEQLDKIESELMNKDLIFDVEEVEND